MPGPTVQSLPASVGLIPGGGSLHFRIAALNGAGLLGALVTIPSWTQGLEVRYPKAVYICIEAGGATTARYTVDGQAASATLGMAIPTEPSYTRIDVQDAIRNSKIGGANSAANAQVALWTSGATNLQVFFEP